MASLTNINGLNIIVVKPPKIVSRGWKERLFSLPWRPFRKFRDEKHPMWDLMEGNDVYVYGRNAYVSVNQFSKLKKRARKNYLDKIL